MEQQITVFYIHFLIFSDIASSHKNWQIYQFEWLNLINYEVYREYELPFELTYWNLIIFYVLKFRSLRLYHWHWLMYLHPSSEIWQLAKIKTCSHSWIYYKIGHFPWHNYWHPSCFNGLNSIVFIHTKPEKLKPSPTGFDYVLYSKTTNLIIA